MILNRREENEWHTERSRANTSTVECIRQTCRHCVHVLVVMLISAVRAHTRLCRGVVKYVFHTRDLRTSTELLRTKLPGKYSTVFPPLSIVNWTTKEGSLNTKVKTWLRCQKNLICYVITKMCKWEWSLLKLRFYL